MADMAPNCPFLTALNAPPAYAARYWAVQAAFKPSGNLAAILEKGGQDIVFGTKSNDLIVPTDGVSCTPDFNLTTCKPVQYSQFTGSEVNHVNYFYQPETWDAIMSFLR